MNRVVVLAALLLITAVALLDRHGAGGLIGLCALALIFWFLAFTPISVWQELFEMFRRR
jgi:hypothetical protein